MLDDAFQASTDQALTDLIQRPRPPKPQEPSFSMWGLVRAPVRAVPAGVAEAGASIADVAGAVGTLNLASNVPEGASMLADLSGGLGAPAEARQAAAARMQSGEMFRGGEFATTLRNVAKDYMPDPATAHGAEVAVAEFFRLATKAVGAGVTLGPLAGALVAGAEEGFTESEKLAQQGVSVEARSQVGAVTGALTALGFALPVAGQTMRGTVGLAVAGGPVSFVAQQSATREILDNAGYDRLADQYDPLDPVGLTLSALVPLGFGMAAMRQAARAGRVTPSPTLPERTPIAKAIDEFTVDAARVNLLRENIEGRRLTSKDDLIGSQAHETAVARAIDQMAAGERVNVTDLIPPQVAERAIREIDSALARVNEDLWFSSSTVSDLSTLDPKFAKDGNLYGPAVYLARSREFSETYARGGIDPRTGQARPEGQTYQAEFKPENPLDADRVYTKAEAENILSAAGIDAKKVRDLLANKAKASGETIYKALTSALGTKAKANEALILQGYDSILFKSKGEQLAASLRPIDVTPAPPRQQAPIEPVRMAPRETPTQELTLEPLPGETAGPKPESPAVEAAARELEQTMPDLMVRMDGMEEAVPLSELMARVRQEVADDLAEVPLLETAAACFVRSM